MRRPVGLTLLKLLLAGQIFAADPATKLNPDGFPTGKETPEGVACDFARAFIHDDAALFLATCIEPYGNPEAKTASHKFLEAMVVQMKLDPAGSAPSPDAPKSIVKCFAARHLGKVPDGSTSFGFQDVMFVDVLAQTRNDKAQLCRTLVIKTRDGKWAVDPQPEQSPLLLNGLDDESPSSQEYHASLGGK